MSLLEQVIIKGSTKEKPIWLMRQAGRYLPEFREIREKNQNFIQLCLNEKLVPEITLQPLKRFNIDAFPSWEKAEDELISFTLGTKPN